MMAFIPQMEPVVTDADVSAVNAYMRSGGWLTEFEQTRCFEQQIAEFTGAPHCAVAPSGTLALFLALTACGIGRDDEVIVPDLTMAATATAVLLAGGKVVFADIEPETLCLDVSQVDQLITPRTRAIVFVPLNGRSPGNLADVVARWQRQGVRVIEDAAQALGSYIGGRHLGTLGDCGCLSFSSQKIVTTGQGGAVVTSDEQVHATMRLLRDFGRTEGGCRSLSAGRLESEVHRSPGRDRNRAAEAPARADRAEATAVCVVRRVARWCARGFTASHRPHAGHPVVRRLTGRGRGSRQARGASAARWHRHAAMLSRTARSTRVPHEWFIPCGGGGLRAHALAPIVAPLRARRRCAGLRDDQNVL